ncbi:hypothetical protein RHMOL_Rhmol07G0139900 [Rhododendron molle]|uniref:Uncharacterized protein n=1 Tax=Rhododendron molle TaxID=49168 RepID=A0ACC0N1H7_RHOML|nr:hypothetical protein RHMOL_Rhmol07G0139900 [Rhododendron molle]
MLVSLLGFFQGSTFRPEEISEQTAPRLSYLPSTEPFMPLKSRKFMDDPDCFFVGSSNSGIILCGRHPSTYFVCSPLADRWVRLPPPNDKTCGAMNVAVAFSYEEIQDTVSDTVRGRYRVVRANLRSTSEIAHDTLLIETYSSETGVWEESVLRGCIPFLVIPRWPGTVLRGIFYWVAYQSTIVAYDPDGSHNRVWLIELPPTTGVQNVVLGESSSDGLLQCGIDDNIGSSLGLKVLRLQKNLHGYGCTAMVSGLEWTVLYAFRYDWQVDQYPRLIAFYPLDPRFLLIRFGLVIAWFNVAEGFLYTPIVYYGNILSGFEFHLFPLFLPLPWPAALP